MASDLSGDTGFTSILVIGLSSRTTKDALQYYFENSRQSSGGDVKEVKVDGDKAIVTFELPEIAKRVLEWGKHTLDDHPLTVSRMQQDQPKKPTPTSEHDSATDEERSRVVRITGISHNTTKDALLNFFENKRRSGGGEIEDIQYIQDESLADITFCSAEDAERVSQKESLLLDDAKIGLTLKEIPKVLPKDLYKLHVMDISDTTTKDGLTSFIEVASGEEILNMIFGNIEKVQRKCSTRALDGSHVKIETVSICDCVEVCGLGPSTTRDTILYYFENARKSGGGDVKKVEYVDEESKALVFFEDFSVVDSVVARKHVINDATLKVVPHYSFLGETSANPRGRKKEEQLKVDPQTMVVIEKFFHQEFQALLQEYQMKCTCQQGSGDVELCSIDDKIEKTKWEDSCIAIETYINQIVTHEVVVSQAAWNEMIEQAKQKCSSVKDRLDVVCKEKERLIIVRGKKLDVDLLAEQLDDLSKEIDKKIEYEKAKITEVIVLTKPQLDLLSSMGFVKNLQAQFKDLEATMLKEDEELSIHFRGPNQVVREGTIAVWQTLSKMKDHEMELPKSIVSIFASTEGITFLSKELKNNQIDAVVSSDTYDETKLIVTAVDRRDVNKAIDLIKKVTAEDCVSLDPDQERLIMSERWMQLMDNFKKSMLLKVTTELASSTVWIAGVKEEVVKAKSQIDAFFEENTITSKMVEADTGRTKFLLRFEKDQMKRIEETLKCHSVEVAPHYSFLGETSANPRDRKKEEQLKVDPQTMFFIDKFFHQEFQALLQEYQMKCTCKQGSGDVELCSIDIKIEKTKWEDHCTAIETYINQIVTRTVVVSQAAWNEMIEQAKQQFLSVKDRLDVVCKEKERLIIVRGKKQDVDLLAEQLDDLSKEIDKKIEYDKAKITKAISLTKPQLDLLNSMGFVKKIQAHFKDLEATMLKEDEELSIHFRGSDQVVGEGNIAVWVTLSKMKDQEMELPKSIVSIVTSIAGNVFLSKELKNNQIDAVISSDAYDETKLTVTAVDRRDVNKAMDLIKKVTAEDSVSLDPDQKRLIMSERWMQLIDNFKKSMLLKVTTELASSTMWIAGVKEEVVKAKSQIDAFFEENTIISKMVEADAGRTKFLFRFEKDEIKRVEETLKHHSVKICCDENDEDISIRGTKEGTEQACKNVQKLIDQIKHRTIDLDKPGIKRLFNESQGKKLLSNVEDDHTCIIERCTLTDDNKRRSAVGLKLNESLSKRICSYVTPEGKNIILFKGDLTEHKVDVMVNAANQRLQHIGGVAKAITQKGGREIQAECDELVLRHGEVLDGEVVVTSPGKLPCKRLVHAVGPTWRRSPWSTYKDEETKEELILGQTVFNALDEAKHFTSIALPAISAGVFGFPADVCAKTILESVLAYSEENARSKLSEIHIVDMNDDVLKAFTHEMRSRFSKDKSHSDSAAPVAKIESGKGSKFRGRRKKEELNNPRGRFDEDDLTNTLIGSVRVELVPGDITKEATEAIVTVSNTSLDLSLGGGVGAAIARKGGRSIQMECNKLGKQEPGSVVCTSAGTLPSQKVFHLVSASYKPRDITYAISKCFSMAESKGISSIAVPAVGTGNASIAPKEAAKALLNAVGKFCKTTPSSVKLIRIVVFQEHMLKDFYDAIEDLAKAESTSGASGGSWSWLKGLIIGSGGANTKGHGPSTTDRGYIEMAGNSGTTFKPDTRMWLKVFASSDKQLSKADTAIKELIREQSKKKTIESPNIEGLSHTQEKRILRLQARYFTEIEVQKRFSRIIISGVINDVSETAFAIFEILNEKAEEEHKRKYAVLVSKNVHWFYIDGDEEVQYGDATNAKIEQAYMNKQTSINITFLDERRKKEQRYKIDFASMTETNVHARKTTRVVRKEHGKGIPLPSHWEPQPRNVDGKEKVLHLVPLDPVKHQQEYNSVKNAITKTSPINIVNIERIQNPEVYQAYMVKKQKMDEKNGSNEKKLFHGTPVDICDLINHHGFNRSYCGKNAVVFGKGVYFARDASYSMRPTYSPPDPTGNRCMYLARVLVGECALGNSNMIIPPPKDPNNPILTYDTTVDNVNNPSVFVAFHDNQNYPEYLITFK